MRFLDNVSGRKKCMISCSEYAKNCRENKKCWCLQLGIVHKNFCRNLSSVEFLLLYGNFVVNLKNLWKQISLKEVFLNLDYAFVSQLKIIERIKQVSIVCEFFGGS